MEPLLVVPANDIDVTGTPIDAELPIAWLRSQLADADASPTTPGHITGRLSRSGKADMVVRCRVTASLDLPCARCLQPAPLDVKTELSLLLKPRPVMHGAGSKAATAKAAGSKAGASKSSGAKGSGAAPREGGKARDHKHHAEYEFSGPEADLDEYDGEKVVLDEWVREAILLELPSFPLCSEGCEGVAGAVGLKITVADAAEAHRAEAKEIRANPFEALRNLMPGSNQDLPSGETAGNTARPGGADLRRISRAKKRTKPKIRTSAALRSKKSGG